MGGIVNKITDTIGLTDYSGLMDASRQGGLAALGGMEEALSFLREADEMPRQFREQAMQRLADVYGFGSPKAQKQFYKNLPNDPFYKMMSQGAEEAYLRGQSATGQLRGGESIMGVANLENKLRQATLANQLGGINSIMRLPDYTPQIYSSISGIGQQKGMNIMNLAQQQQANQQAGFGNLLGIGQMLSGFGWNPLEK